MGLACRAHNSLGLACLLCAGFSLAFAMVSGKGTGFYFVNSPAPKAVTDMAHISLMWLAYFIVVSLLHKAYMFRLGRLLFQSFLGFLYGLAVF